MLWPHATPRDRPRLEAAVSKAVPSRIADSMDADHVNGMVQLYVGWGTH